LISSEKSSKPLDMWIRIAIALQALAFLMQTSVGFLWKGENNPFIGVFNWKGASVSAVLSIFLLWKIRQRKNWARRFFIATVLLILPFFPSFIIPSSSEWRPSHLEVLWSVWRIFTAIDTLFICGFVLYLFKPEVRVEFIKQPPKPYQRILISGYAVIALLLGFVLIWMSSRVNQWSKQGKPPAKLANWIEKQTERELAIVRGATGIQMPPLGYTKKPIQQGAYWIVPMMNFEKGQSFIIVISPKDEDVDLQRLFNDLDQQYAQKAERAGSFVNSILKSRKGSWSKLTPIKTSPVSIMLNGTPYEIQHVDFALDSPQREGFLARVTVSDKRLTCLCYGKGDSKAGIADFLQQVRAINSSAPSTTGLGK